MVIPLKSQFCAKFHLKHERKDVRGFSSACVSHVNHVYMRLPWLFQPSWGADIRQLVPEAGDSNEWAVLHGVRAGVPCCFPDAPPSRIFPFAWVVVGFCLRA